MAAGGSIGSGWWYLEDGRRELGHGREAELHRVLARPATSETSMRAGEDSRMVVAVRGCWVLSLTSR